MQHSIPSVSFQHNSCNNAKLLKNVCLEDKDSDVEQIFTKKVCIPRGALSLHDYAPSAKKALYTSPLTLSSLQLPQ